MSRVHPSDLSSFLKYMERLHKPSGTWFENHQENIFEHTYRLKHHSGNWVWVREQLFVLSLTPEGLLDKVFITFTDVTEWKKKQEEEKLAALSVQSKKSKLIEAVVKYKKIQEEKNASASADDLFLTPREKQVLELVSKGYSSKQIAHHLFISRHTVESHRKHLLKKLNVNNAAELVVKANLSSLN
jgi:DNA-binding CsgD family transcriptional regulator